MSIYDEYDHRIHQPDDEPIPDSERVCCYWSVTCPHPGDSTLPLVPIADPTNAHHLVHIHEDCLDREHPGQADRLKAAGDRIPPARFGLDDQWYA